MFKFDFDLEDEDETLDFASLKIIDDESPKNSELRHLQPYQEIDISQLLDALPPVISYSPLVIPLSSIEKPLVLARRDFFDARFQLISQGEDENNVLQFFESPSDLVAGVYEGGFKTWECSLDLVNYLESDQSALMSNLIGKRILEVGCGTAAPTLYLLHQILSSPIKDDRPRTTIHVQDYNTPVLELVTLPNLILTWLISPASRSSLVTESHNPSELSEVNIKSELKAAFRRSLQEHNISLRFFSGSWETFNSNSLGEVARYDLVLSSETIYRTDSLRSLVKLLHLACVGDNQQDPDHQLQNSACKCLVAAKAVYFGVGGGVESFSRAAEECNGKVESVWETTMGVKRKVLSVTWK